MEPKTFEEFDRLYSAQLNFAKLYHFLCEIEYPNTKLIDALKSQFILISEQLGGGYFTDPHWLKEPLGPHSAYHLYCLQMIKE